MDKLLIDLGGGRRPKTGYQSLDLFNAKYICNIEEGLPFETEAVDRLYSHHCLEHLKEPKIPFVLQECYRVLKRGSEFEVTVPDFNDALERFKTYEGGDVRSMEWFGMIYGSDSEDFQDRHWTLFTEMKLRNQLETAGFEVGTFDYPAWYGVNLHVIARKV